MKNLAVIILCLMMSLNSIAAVSGSENLIQVFDEYQYAITVDWDQKDDKKLEELTNAFHESLGKTLEKTGLGITEVESILISRIKDTKALEAAKLKLSLLGANPERSELIKLLKEEGRSMYARGSSWNGESTLVSGFLIVALVFFLYGAFIAKGSKCVRWEPSPNLTCYNQQIRECGYYSGECWFRDGPLVCEYLTQCAEYVQE